jgi:hypothetical protein
VGKAKAGADKVLEIAPPCLMDRPQ